MVGWLPVIDLPFPLVIVASVMLAIASNRKDPSTLLEESQSSPQFTTNAAPSSQVRDASTIGPPMSESQAGQEISGKENTLSPSLPNLGGQRDRPISPEISPIPPVSGTINASPTAKRPAEPAPQLPTFVRPARKKKNRVSFTIEGNNE